MRSGQDRSGLPYKGQDQLHARMTKDVARLAAAFRGSGPAVARLDNPPRTLAEGYALQDRVRAELGRPVVGWKLSHAARAVQLACGLDAPTVAPLLEGMIVPGETMFAAGSFRAPVVESEIVLQIGTTLAGPRRKEEVIAALAGMRIAIEITDSRYADKAAMGIPARIGDLDSASTLVIGPLMDLNELHAALTAEPTVRLGDGTITDALPRPQRPSPIEAVSFLTRFLAERDIALPAGCIVTTGTHSVPSPTGPGQVAIRFGDTMRVGARLGASRSGRAGDQSRD